MYVEKKTIKMSETDATGAIYFTELLKMATEAFESFLDLDEKLALPIVHAEADYFVPIRWRDELMIKLSLEKEGESSFTLLSEFFRADELMGRTRIVHVAQPSKTEALKALLKQLA